MRHNRHAHRAPIHNSRVSLDQFDHLSASPPLIAESLSDKWRVLSDLVASFSDVQRIKLADKLREGQVWWNDPTIGDRVERLRNDLSTHVIKYDDGKDPDQLVDIANIAAMLWWHTQQR
jgi:hypothetical protein